VSIDGVVDQRVTLLDHLILDDGYGFWLSVTDADVGVGSAAVRFHDVPEHVDLVPIPERRPRTPEARERRIQELLEQLDPPAGYRDPRFKLLDDRIDVLNHLMEAKPSLRPTLGPRRDAIIKTRAVGVDLARNMDESELERLQAEADGAGSAAR